MAKCVQETRQRALRPSRCLWRRCIDVQRQANRIRGEAQLTDYQALDEVFKGVLSKFVSLSQQYAGLLAEKASLPNEKLSEEDSRKLKLLSDLLREQASDFKFTTFPPDELSISEDSYRPEKEGFEIGFETSASDAIRLKWAYQLGLLEVAEKERTNHLGLLVFDEPRQQSSSKVSFAGLLARASRSKERDQQVIFSTSEELSILSSITSSIDCELRVYEGYILQPLGTVFD